MLKSDHDDLNELNNTYHKGHTKDTLNRKGSNDNLILDDAKSNSQTNLHIRRLIILTVYCILSAFSMFNLSLYGDLKKKVAQFYSFNLTYLNENEYEPVNWLFNNTIYFSTNFVFLLPAMFILDYKGLKLTCQIGIFLTCIGTWIKCCSIWQDFFIYLIVGQFMCGIGQAFLQSSIVKICGLWFGKKEVAVSLAVFRL